MTFNKLKITAKLIHHSNKKVKHFTKTFHYVLREILPKIQNPLKNYTILI